MAATTVERLYEYEGFLPRHGTDAMADDITILKGTIVTQDSSNNADTPADGQDALGIALSTVVNPAGGSESVEYSIGVHTVLYDGIAPEKGELVYVLDNQTVTLDSNINLRGIAGVCTRQGVSGKCSVMIGAHVFGLMRGAASLP